MDALPPAPTAPSEAAPALFRREALDAQRDQSLGTVLVAPGLSGAAFALFALAAGGATAALLAFGGYTQKARIAGWLTPDSGIVRVYAPEAGRIVKLHVAEGDKVARGAPLASISTERESETLGRARAESIAQLRSRKASLEAERERQGSLFALQERELKDRLRMLEGERKHLVEEIALQRSRVALAEEARGRLAALRAKGVATESALQDSERDRLRIAADLQELERDRIANERASLEAEARLRELPLGRDGKIGEIDRSIAILAQDLAEAEAAREFVVTAPQDGIVTGVRGALGGGVRADAPLLSVVPAGSPLTAELFAPSRAIGFLRPGQPVLLRYQSFPYQKFGAYRGVVTRISRTAVSPSELPPQLSGLTSLFGADEPVYRIEVTPERQTATAYGEPVPLQAGMQLEADIQIDRRQLYEWVLDPLYTLTGRPAA
jgi:membrane fusion protein